jgi:chromosome segregation ATPase
MSKTSKIVSDLLEERASRLHKIKQASSSVEDKIKELNVKMTGLLNKFVKLDLLGNTEEKNIVDKSIKELRLEIEDLNNKKEAYQRVSVEDISLKDGLTKAIEIAREENAERIERFLKKIEERDAFKIKLEEMENELKRLDSEISDLHKDKQAKELRPLLKYIEPRKIRSMGEEDYLRVLVSEGPSSQYLEQYIEPVRNLERQPENLCRNIVYNS